MLLPKQHCYVIRNYLVAKVMKQLQLCCISASTFSSLFLSLLFAEEDSCLPPQIWIGKPDKINNACLRYFGLYGFDIWFLCYLFSFILPRCNWVKQIKAENKLAFPTLAVSVWRSYFQRHASVLGIVHLCFTGGCKNNSTHYVSCQGCLSGRNGAIMHN